MIEFFILLFMLLIWDLIPLVILPFSQRFEQKHPRIADAYICIFTISLMVQFLGILIGFIAYVAKGNL